MRVDFQKVRSSVSSLQSPSCCSVLQCALHCCSVLQCALQSVHYSHHHVAVCCSVLFTVAVCCSVLFSQCATVTDHTDDFFMYDREDFIPIVS